MRASAALSAVAALATLLVTVPAHGAPLNVVYIPLDERFTTRDAFLNLAQVTPFNVSTPPASIISLQRRPAVQPAFDDWVAAALPHADAAVISLELFVYGGLINSRCGNESAAAIQARVQALIDYAAARPATAFYLGAVVMRIPTYNTVPAVEDPWYWAFYGADIYTYSFYLSKFNATGNATDYATAMAAAAKVPPAVLSDWVARRARNNAALESLLRAYAASVAAGAPLFRSLYITQDDNAEYGFNIDEARALKALVASLGLGGYVRIYPGADEVGLTMLSRLAVDVAAAATTASAGGDVPPQAPPSLELVFRRPDNASLYLVPNYEGQPMIDTLLDQVAAAGAVAASSSSWADGLSARTRAHPALAASAPAAPPAHAPAVLLVNNFGTDEYPQIEAPSQTTTGRSIVDYAAMFTPAACGSAAATGAVVSLADNRYSNGADVLAVAYLRSLGRNASCAVTGGPTSNRGGLGLDRSAYAGWNTDGNTLGTAIANLVLLAYFGEYGARAGESAALVARIDAWVDATRSGRSGDGSGGVPPNLRLRAAPAAAATAPPPSPAAANAYFNVLRVVEDCFWQAGLRQALAGYTTQVDGQSPYTLGDDLPFYERYAWKVLASRAGDVAADFGGVNVSVASLYYPWNRTFEIGLVGPGASPLTAAAAAPSAAAWL